MDRKPKRRDINKYVKPFAAYKWQDLGLELEVGDEDGVALDEIRGKYGENQEECFDRMIAMWLKDTNASQLTWRVLLECLKSSNLNEAVQAVQLNIFGALEPDSSMELKIAATNSETPSSTSSESNGGQCIQSAAQENLHDNKLESTYQDLTSDIPLSIDGPPLDMLSDKIAEPAPVGYALTLEEGRKIRGYQTELAQPGIEGKNYIVVAPTGSGKTLVAAMVISDHLQKGRARDSDEVRRVAFIVDKRPLAQQQKDELSKLIPTAKIICCAGDDANVQDIFKQGGAHIIVCTAGKLKNALRNEFPISNFSLIVFDECHHAKKVSPYAEVMTWYIRDKLYGKNSKLPQVMGMTASPGAGDNPRLEKTVTIDHLVNLCALMDATSGIKTVQEKLNKTELERHTNMPDHTILISMGRDETEPFIVKAVQFMQELEKEVKFNCPFKQWSQEYKTQVRKEKADQELSLDKISRNLVSILKLLCCLNEALEMYMDLRYEDAMGILKVPGLPSREKANALENELNKRLKLLLSNLSELSCINNPLLNEMESILSWHFTTNPSTKAMVFVRTKQHASSIFHWAQCLPKNLEIKPSMAVGQTESATGYGMTQPEQKKAFEEFKVGPSNLLVATSIGEEGIDVPGCNLVIRYQHVSNEIARAQTAGRARATGDCEVVTILSSEKKQGQEVKNSELLALVNGILITSQFPLGDVLKMKIKRAQAEILEREHESAARLNEKQSKYRTEDVQLRCRHCKERACSGADIRLLGFSYVIPGEEFQSKITKKLHPKPINKPKLIKSQKIFCKKCDAPWGNICKWPPSESEFPVLKCTDFIFEYKDEQRLEKKWSCVPFKIEKFDGSPKPAATNDE